MAGALALDFLRLQGIDIISYVSAIGSESMDREGEWFPEKSVFSNILHCPDRKDSLRMQQEIDEAVAAKDSVGGKITTVIKGLPAGVGEPVFGKLNAVLGLAVLSIPGAKGVDFGEGFDGLSVKGSEYNDVPIAENTKISFASNHSGGIQAGISNGNHIVMNTVFRPSSSIGIQQSTVDLEGNSTTILVSGRHDACYVPRAAIVVTAMTAVAIMDLWLQFKSSDRKY
ncbi:Chorismate synthase [bioreactor metagenome]|uniref:chorismate synthase n=1 Tax=bioreactor metagenome TaxID=1076179 RepID=A0A644ZP53_9ZZZZ